MMNYEDNVTMYHYARNDTQYNEAGSVSDNYVTLYKFANKYVLPNIIFVGLIGNSISIAIFSTRDLRKMSSSIYILAVLASDTGMLFSVLPAWLTFLGIEVVNYPVSCPLFIYLPYICSFLSVWYVVCITVENYITTCHPTQMKTYCTVPRARIVSVGLFLGSLAIYAITVIKAQIIHGVCRSDEIGLTYADSVITILLPSVVILTLLTFIVSNAVKSFHRKRKRTTVENNYHLRQHPQFKVATLLFAISVTYVILNIPLHIMRLRSLIMGILDIPQIPFSEQIIMAMLLIVSYVNAAAKFFLFYACSGNFRKVLFKCCKRSPGPTPV